MKIYDVTLPLSPLLPIWPGDPPFELVSVASTARGDPFNLTALHMSPHMGTHVDAPAHALDGTPTVDQLPLDALVGEALLLRIPDHVRLITGHILEAAAVPPGTRRLLLATANAALWDRSPVAFSSDYVCLTPDAAQWIVDRGTDLVGLDYLSVEPPDASGRPVHTTLLSAGIILLEGLDLRGVPAGAYRLCCLPLKLVGADGAPARAILTSEA